MSKDDQKTTKNKTVLSESNCIAHTNATMVNKDAKKMTHDANDGVLANQKITNIKKLGLKLFKKRYFTWHNQFEQSGVSVGSENYLLNDHEFKKDFYKTFIKKYNFSPSFSVWQQLLKEFDNICQFEGTYCQTYKRTAVLNDTLIYDHCDLERHVTVITAHGRETKLESPVFFLRTPDMAEQCLPAEKGNIDAFNPFINVRHKYEAICLKAAIVKSFIPDFENPIVGIFGSQGSGKTTMMDFIMQIVAPSHGSNITSIPSSESTLLDIANNNHCCAFDNVSSINDKQADTFCRISTGVKNNTKLVFTKPSQNAKAIRSMILLNGINNVLLQPDLADRSIVVFTKTINKRNSLEDIQKEFLKSKPEIIAGIFDGISSYFRNKNSINLKSPPRMMDFALMIAAAEQGLGWAENTFIEGYSLCTNLANRESVETSLIAIAVLTYMKSHSDPSATMSAYCWLYTLKSSVDCGKSLPSDPKSFSQELFKLELPLKAAGITLERIRTAKERIIKITYAHSKRKHSEILKIDDLPYIEEPGRDEEGEQAEYDIDFKNIIEADKLIGASYTPADSDDLEIE